jgi:hypothetical protein
MQVARELVKHAIGEQTNGTALPEDQCDALRLPSAV